MNLQFALTKKLNDSIFGIDPLLPVPGNFESFFSWHLNLIFLDRQRYLLFTNDLTLFSVLIDNVREVGARDIQTMFRQQLEINLGGGSHRYFKSGDSIHFCKCHSRKVMASMNSSKKALYDWYYDQKLPRGDIAAAANQHLNSPARWCPERVDPKRAFLTELEAH